MFNKYQNHTWRKNSGTYSFTDTLEFNFFPVNLSSDNVTVHKTEFIDKDNYSKFKNDLPPSCFCWRNSLDAKYIYVWSTDSSEPPKIEDLQTEDLFFDSNPVLTCRLISEGLKKELEVRGFTTLDNYKKSVFVNFNKKNFLSKMGAGIDSRVGIYPKFVILYKYIEALYPNNAYILRTELDNELLKFNSPKEKHRLINAFVNLFLSNGSYQPIEICNGASFTFAQKYQPRTDSYCFKFRRLNKPVYEEL